MVLGHQITDKNQRWKNPDMRIGQSNGSDTSKPVGKGFPEEKQRGCPWVVDPLRQAGGGLVNEKLHLSQMPYVTKYTYKIVNVYFSNSRVDVLEHVCSGIYGL